MAAVSPPQSASPRGAVSGPFQGAPPDAQGDFAGRRVHGRNVLAWRPRDACSAAPAWGIFGALRQSEEREEGRGRVAGRDWRGSRKDCWLFMYRSFVRRVFIQKRSPGARRGQPPGKGRR